MKSATIPPLRVSPELRRAAEELLAEGETLSGFVEQSLREGIQRRRLQGEFIARGLLARDAAQATGGFVAAEAVLGKLDAMLADAKTRSPRR